ncbi:diaminopimelate epimerase [Pseudomonas sp. BN102]|uniref:diaminopimelate epimerase n=1 Tax=Pseudomonas sp. BN102 TaxID=2567886 RepID=UPI0024539AD6|nr:diaminopimelate epimerase [Pseudomonas sp. BN102]
MDFIKYTAQGNDYIVIDPNKLTLPMTPENIKKICDRRTGIGADGILHGPHLKGESLGLFTYNADGSTCSRSGNGLRIFSRYLIDHDYCQANTVHITLLPEKNPIEVHKTSSGNQFVVNMGNYAFELKNSASDGQPPKMIFNEPVTLAGHEFSLSCVNIANPYGVLIPRSANTLELETLVPEINALDILPPRSNLLLAKSIQNNCIKLTCWEPGAGLTQASGGGACAAMAVCFEMGLVEDSALVKMPGGNVLLFLDRDGSTTLTGSVSQVCSGFFSLDFENTIAHAC